MNDPIEDERQLDLAELRERFASSEATRRGAVEEIVSELDDPETEAEWEEMEGR